MARKKVLIIDDNEDICFLVIKALEKAGDIDAAYALTGKDGIGLAGRFKPDLVFLDLKLPDAHGVDLIKELLRLDKKTQIVILSGKGTHEYVQAAFEAGAVDFMPKPAAIDRLLDITKKYLGAKPQPPEEGEPGASRFIKSLFLDTLTSFVYLTEAKSRYLKGHSREVAMLAKKIGRKMGLNGPQLEVLECAALLHDIGKVGIKDILLDKSSGLTPKERKEMEAHSAIGSEIIHKVRLFRLEEPIIKYHHERYDGKGYPDGLRGRGIPVGASIIALADAYSAMTTSRPYRERLKRAEAIKEIRKNSGKQFDPLVVDAFLKVCGGS